MNSYGFWTRGPETVWKSSTSKDQLISLFREIIAREASSGRLPLMGGWSAAVDLEKSEAERATKTKAFTSLGHIQPRAHMKIYDVSFAVYIHVQNEMM